MENLTLNEEKLRDLYLRKLALGEIQGPIVGKASVDKPWLQYYPLIDDIEAEKNTVYQEVYNNNQKFLNTSAIEFFGTKITYNKFFLEIEKTAKAFEEYGIKKGDFVTICSAGIPETAYSFYALSKIGAIANMMAPYFDKEEMIKRIEECESDVLIVMDKFYDEVKETIKKSRIKNIIVLPTLNSSLLNIISKKYKLEKNSSEIFWNQFIKDGSARKSSAIVDYEKDMPLAMVYSSGTTGASKGILLSNDSFQNSVQSYLKSGVDLSRGQKFYQIIPTWYSTGLSTSLHLPLSCGASVFMDPRFERNVFVKNIIKAHPNYTVAPTSMYEGFLDSKLVKNKDLSFFNYPFEGGEPLTKEVAERIENVFKSHGNNSKLRVGYGQCECGATITTETPQTEHSNGSVGIPLPDITIGIFDDDYNELPYLQRGHILVNTPCSMLGYYNNQQATDEYFYVDKKGTKWNCTGDIGYIDQNGHLYIQGRANDYTIINDKKIYNFDIEKCISSLPEIKMCDVIDKKDDKGESTLVVHIIFEDEIINKFNNNSDLLYDELHKLQEVIYNQTLDMDMVPYIFKIRSEFPYAKSGKRDIIKLKNETDGFIEIDKYDIKIKKMSL